MERKPRLIWLMMVLGLMLLATSVQAQWDVTIGIKQTDGRWQDTLLAGETNFLTIAITNPIPVAAYTLPFEVSSEANGAFAQLQDASQVSYVGRMADLSIFTIRTINQTAVNGTDADSILFGGAEFGSNFLPAGSSVEIEFPLDVDPFVGTVRIDTATLPPANILSFTDSLANTILAVAFNANPVFPVVLRVPNGGPTCSGTSDINSPFGVPLAQTVTGIDPESDPLTFQQISGPGTTTGAGDWSWNPGCGDVGVYDVCVTISDPNHLDWDTCCFSVTVTQTAPTLTCADQTIHYSNTLSYFLSGSDDACPLPLEYFKLSGPGSLSAGTGEYTWTPVCGDVGFHFVDVGVTDGQDTVLCTFRVTVTNSPPVINCPPNFSAGIGDPVDFLIGASDPDGDSLVFTLIDFVKLSGPTGGGPNNPATLSADGQFFWQTSDANDDDFGVWEVSLRVDEPCDSAFCTFEIEVTPNRPPICTAPSDLNARWGEPAQASFVFSDPDGDSISFQQISGPGTMDVNGNWSWFPGCGDVGIYEVCAVVADSAFPGDTCCFQVTVFQSAPLLECADDSVHAGAGPLVINLTAPDDGCPGNPVRFFKVSGQGTLDSVTGVYTLEPNLPGFSCDEIGDYPVTVYATDGVLADTCSFVAKIYNNPPFLACALDTLEHTSDRIFSYATHASDPDGDVLDTVFLRSFEKLAGPPGGPNNPPLIDNDGLITWQTDSSNTNDLGLWRAVPEARDSCDLSRCTLYIEVVANRPPICLSTDVVGLVLDTTRNGVLGLDSDSDLVIFQQISGPGSFVVAEGAARWFWVADCSERGTYEVCFTVSDSVFADADTCCFQVTIVELPPVINCSDQTVHYGDTLFYDIPFEDDACPVAATWSLIDGPGSVDPVTGRYTLPTACGDVGSVPVTVTLADSLSVDTCTFLVDITNTAPFVECPDDIVGLKIGATVDLDINFGDVDGDAVTISLIGFQKLGGVNPNPPNNAPTLDGAGHFNWVTEAINFDDVATWEVTVQVDEPCDSAICTFRIEILPNDPPVCTAPNDTDAVCTDPIGKFFTATDPEGDDLTYRLVFGPGAIDSVSGEWTWTPPCDSGGVYDICVTVSDFLHQDVDTCCFMLSICAVGVPGDVDASDTADAQDILLLVNFIFKSDSMPFGDYTADMNCDGVPDSRDIIVLVNYVFKSGPPPCNVCESPLFPFANFATSSVDRK